MKYVVEKMVNNWSGQKLQNKKGYTESQEFSPTLGLFIFKEVHCYNLRQFRSLMKIFLNTHTHIKECSSTINRGYSLYANKQSMGIVRRILSMFIFLRDEQG